MVDADLQTATAELAGEFEGLDVRSIMVTGAGLGLGLFSAEFFAEITGNMFGGSSIARRNGVEILTKFGVSGGAFMLRRFIGGPLVGAMLILAAVGASTSAILQMVEVVVSLVQEGSITASMKETVQETASASGGSVADTGYSEQAANVSV